MQRLGLGEPSDVTLAGHERGLDNAQAFAAPALRVATRRAMALSGALGNTSSIAVAPLSRPRRSASQSWPWLLFRQAPKEVTMTKKLLATAAMALALAAPAAAQTT